MTILRWQQHVGFASETNGWGTYSGNPVHWVPVEKCDAKDNPKFYMDEAYRGIQAQDFGAYQTNLAGEFSATGDIYCDTFPWLAGNYMIGNTDSVSTVMVSTLGVGVTTGTVSAHTYLLGNPESLTWFDFNGYSERAYQGGRLSQLSITMSPEKQVQWDLKGEGRLSVLNATSGNVLPATLNGGHTPILTWMGKITIGGVPNLRVIDCNFDLKRKTEILYTQAGTQSPTNIYAFQLGVTGKATFDFVDEAEYNVFRQNSQSSSFSIFFWTDPNNALPYPAEGFSLTFPQLVYNSFDVDRSKDALTAKIGFDGLYSTANSTNITLVVYNNITTTYV